MIVYVCFVCVCLHVYKIRLYNGVIKSHIAHLFFTVVQMLYHYAQNKRETKTERARNERNHAVECLHTTGNVSFLTTKKAGGIKVLLHGVACLRVSYFV